MESKAKNKRRNFKQLILTKQSDKAFFVARSFCLLVSAIEACRVSRLPALHWTIQRQTLVCCSLSFSPRQYPHHQSSIGRIGNLKKWLAFCTEKIFRLSYQYFSIVHVYCFGARRRSIQNSLLYSAMFLELVIMFRSLR